MAKVLTERFNLPLPALAALADRLTRPASSIQGLERRQAQVLSGLLAAIIPVGFIVALITPLLEPGAGLNFGTLFAVAALFGIYLVSRTAHYRIAGLLTVGIINASIYVVTLVSTAPDRISTLNLILALLMIATMVLPNWVTGVLIGVNLGIMALLPTLFPEIPSTIAIIRVFLLGAVFLLVFIWYRDTLERDRRAQIAEAFEQTRRANDALNSANQELITANNIAQESIRLKSEFVSTMSHELRTPLNAILGFCGIMLEGMGGDFDADGRQMLERINANSSRLLILINEVLDLAKIEAGRMELVSSAINPAELAESWRSQTHILAEKNKLDFIVEVDPQLPQTLYGDAERLTQIGVNLLSNAFKFTDSGSVKLAFKRQDDHWLIEVADSGVGIPPHALNYIFEEFRQVDGSSKRVYGGTGLGLAIVRNLVRVMRGQVKATSELGKGSTFTVTLPIITEPNKETMLKSA